MSGCLAALVASVGGSGAAIVAAVKPAAITGPTATTTRARPLTSTTVVAKPSRTVTILVVAPSSGPNAESGAAAVRAVRLAVSHALEDRLLPTDWGVEVETIDEAAKAGPSAAVGRKLAREADIVAVVGALAPATAGPLAAAATKAATAFLVLSPSPAPRGTAVTTGGVVTSAASPPVPLAPLALRMMADDTTTGIYAADYVLNSVRSSTSPTVAPGTAVPPSSPAAPTSVTTNDGSESARAFVTAFADRLIAGGSTVTPLGLASTASGVLTPAFVSKVLQGAPPIVAFGGAVTTALPLSAAARAAPVRSVFLIGGQVGVAGCADALSTLGEGDLCAVGAVPLSASAKARAFREDYAAAGYGAPTVSVAAAYDSATLVIRALRPAIVALGSDPDPDKVRGPLMTALRSIRLDGATGTTSFDADGDRVSAPVSVLRKQDGRWVVVAATG